MAKISHSELKNIEFANVANWSIGFPLPSFIPQSLRKIVDPVGTFFNKYCETTGVPARATQIAETMINGLTYKQVINTLEEGTLSMTFLEDKSYTISRLFELWSQLGVDPLTGKQTPREAHMLPRGFLINGETGQGEVVASYELFYIFPQNIALSEFQGTGELQRVTTNFSYIFHKRHI